MQKRSNHSSGYGNLSLTGRTHMLLQVSWYRSHSVYWPSHEISWKGDNKRPVGFRKCYSLEPHLRSESGAIGGHVLDFSTLCRRFPLRTRSLHRLAPRFFPRQQFYPAPKTVNQDRNTRRADLLKRSSTSRIPDDRVARRPLEAIVSHQSAMPNSALSSGFNYPKAILHMA